MLTSVFEFGLGMIDLKTLNPRMVMSCLPLGPRLTPKPSSFFFAVAVAVIPNETVFEPDTAKIRNPSTIFDLNRMSYPYVFPRGDGSAYVDAGEGVAPALPAGRPQSFRTSDLVVPENSSHPQLRPRGDSTATARPTARGNACECPGEGGFLA